MNSLFWRYVVTTCKTSYYKLLFFLKYPPSVILKKKCNLGTNEPFWESGGGGRYIITHTELCLVFCKENQISY